MVSSVFQFGSTGNLKNGKINIKIQRQYPKVWASQVLPKGRLFFDTAQFTDPIRRAFQGGVDTVQRLFHTAASALR